MKDYEIVRDDLVVTRVALTMVTARLRIRLSSSSYKKTRSLFHERNNYMRVKRLQGLYCTLDI